MIAAGRGPSDRASFIQRGESERAVVPPGRCGFAMVRRSGGGPATGFDLEPLCRMVAPGEARRTGPGEANQSGPCGASRAVRILVRRSGGATARGFDLELSVAWSPLLSTGPIAGQQQRLRTGIEPPR